MAAQLAPSQAVTPVAGAGVRAHRRSRTWNVILWEWLVSLRVGLVLLTILTIASIVGTAIDPLERAQRLVFYTWWYKLLLVGLALNMSCATIRTVAKKVLPSKPLRLQTSAEFFRVAQPSAACSFAGTVEQVAEEFRRQGCEVRTEGAFGVARRGWIGRLGGPVSHLGLVIVLMGGFLSSWLAKEGVIRIAEGRDASMMTLRDEAGTPTPLGFAVTLDDFSTGFFPRTRIPSHFESHVTVRDPAGALLYQGPVEVNHSPLINGWRLHQTSYEELRGGTRRSYLLTPPGAKEPVSLEASMGQIQPIPGLPSQSFRVDASGGWAILEGSRALAEGTLAGSRGSNLTIRAERFEPDFVLGEDRQITSRSQEPNNPALLVVLMSDGAPAGRQWLFGREDMKAFSHSKGERFAMELAATSLGATPPTWTVEVRDAQADIALGTVTLALGVDTPVGTPAAAAATSEDLSAGWKVAAGERVTEYATVLSVTRNPILPVAYVGCLLMMIGLVLGFFVRRREVWFTVADGELRLAAHYRHPAEELDRSTAALIEKLRTSSPAPAQA